MPWLQTNVALYVRIGPACWVPLHERDPVLDRTQRSRAVQRAQRTSSREAHTVPIIPSGMPPNGLCYYTLINIMVHYRPSNNNEK